MSKRYPNVQPLHELRKTCGEFKLNSLAVGRDGRNRTLLSPFAAKTGRNRPSTTGLFWPIEDVRGLIKPCRRYNVGCIVIGLHKKLQLPRHCQNDELLWDVRKWRSIYPHLQCRRAWHRRESQRDTRTSRNRCKSVVLGTNYGMSAYGVAQAAKIHELEAKALLQKHRETYCTFWAWAESNKDRGLWAQTGNLLRVAHSSDRR